MNWSAVALGIGLVVHAIAVAFFFGQQTQRVKFLEDWKKDAEAKLADIALIHQRMEQIEEWRDAKGGARDRIHDLWNFMSVEKAKEYLEQAQHKSGDD